MERYTSTNDLNMIVTPTLNWRIEKENRDGSGEEFYTVYVGGMAEGWIWLLDPRNLMLSCSNLSYSSNETVRFKVDSIDQASIMVNAFAEGMGINMEGTIYTQKSEIK